MHVQAGRGLVCRLALVSSAAAAAASPVRAACAKWRANSAGLTLLASFAQFEIQLVLCGPWAKALGIVCLYKHCSLAFTSRIRTVCSFKKAAAADEINNRILPQDSP